MKAKEGKITVRCVVVGTVFSGFFAFLTVYFENRKDLITTANQIAVLPYVLLFVSVLLINPVCRLLRFVRRFTVTEVLLVFIMCSVSAGISTFGLASQLIPTVGGLYNPDWSTSQSQWSRDVDPFLNEQYFLSAPGIRAAAREYREALLEAQAAEDAKIHRAQDAFDQARRAGKAAGETQRAEQENEDVQAAPESVVELRARLEGLDAAVEAKKKKLDELKALAFEKVSTFRRGLPKDRRAFPGILMLPDDNLDIYIGRWRRLRRGLAALGHLENVERALASAAPAAPAPAPAQIEASLDAAIELLEPVSAMKDLAARKETAAAEWKRANKRLLGVRAELKKLRHERRLADPEEFPRLDEKIGDLSGQAARLDSETAAATHSEELLNVQVDAANRVAATVGLLRTLRGSLGGPDPPSAAKILEEIGSAKQSFPAFDASMRRFLIGEVPWSEWIGPLGRWALLIALTYVVLMTLNILIFRQWAHNERLVYPLAKLPEILAGADEEKSGRTIPPIFRSGLFWIGLAIAGIIMGWNLLCATHVVPGLQALDLNWSWNNYLRHSAFEGLMPNASASIFFTMIGLAFIIPANISFSLWFFWLFYMAQLLILVWAGYGVNENSFPTHWWYTLNFRTAQGGGALMVFAAVILFKCRKYVLCAFMPRSVRGLEDAERTELRISSLLFLLGSVGLVLLLWRGMGANVWYTLVCYFVIIAISLGLARAVAEGGILGFQAWVSPFHFIRTVFGMNKSWTAPALYAPLMVYYSTMFLDLKTFIAPSMANSIKIRDDMKMGRARFHLAVVLCILIAAGVAIATHLMMSYDQGADNMNRWFYTSFPKSVFNKIGSIVKTTPVDTTGCRVWLAFGGLLMVGLLVFRRHFFWLPHPIGLIMLVNPRMYTYWFSLFLGWVAKCLVTKYGNKDTYVKVRDLFIGLIVGELLIVVLAMIIAYSLNIKIPIDLNR